MAASIVGKPPTAEKPDTVVRREIWCYMRSSFAVVRIVFDAVLVMFSMYFSTLGGWNEKWAEIYEFTWPHAHGALMTLEVGIHPPEASFRVQHRVCIERLHLFAYRAITFWALFADFGVIFTAARTIYHEDKDAEHIEQLVIAGIVFVMNLWRLGEIFSTSIEQIHVTESAQHSNVYMAEKMDELAKAANRRNAGTGVIQAASQMAPLLRDPVVVAERYEVGTQGVECCMCKYGEAYPPKDGTRVNNMKRMGLCGKHR